MSQIPAVNRCVTFLRAVDRLATYLRAVEVPNRFQVLVTPHDTISIGQQLSTSSKFAQGFRV